MLGSHACWLSGRQNGSFSSGVKLAHGLEVIVALAAREAYFGLDAANAGSIPQSDGNSFSLDTFGTARDAQGQSTVFTRPSW